MLKLRLIKPPPEEPAAKPPGSPAPPVKLPDLAKGLPLRFGAARWGMALTTSSKDSLGASNETLSASSSESLSGPRSAKTPLSERAREAPAGALAKGGAPCGDPAAGPAAGPGGPAGGGPVAAAVRGALAAGEATAGEAVAAAEECSVTVAAAEGKDVASKAAGVEATAPPAASAEASGPCGCSARVTRSCAELLPANEASAKVKLALKDSDAKDMEAPARCAPPPP